MSIHDAAWSGELQNASPEEIWWREFRIMWVRIAELYRLTAVVSAPSVMP